jgi:RNA polymerase sigma-70 factor (ECF subfamily)
MSSGIYTKGLASEEAELEAKRAVYRSSLRTVWGVLKKMGCPDDELLDLAHKTYSIAFGSWDSFRGDSRRETWVVGIALNVARNYLRREDKCRFEAFTDEDDMGSAGWGTPARSPEEEAQWRQRVRLLREAMKQLRSDQRQLLELVLIQQLSISEAASRLGVSQRQAYTLKDGGVAQLTSILRRRA